MQLSRHGASTFPFLADRPPVAFQRSPYRLPILRCGFHHHFLDLLLDQPLRKPLQLLGVATVPASLKLVFVFHFDVSHNHRQPLLVHIDSRYPISHGFLLGGKRRACHALHIQAHVAIAAPARGTATPIHSLNYACSGSGRVTASTGATVRSTSPLPRASHCALALTDFHEVSRAVGPNWQGRETRDSAQTHQSSCSLGERRLGDCRL